MTLKFFLFLVIIFTLTNCNTAARILAYFPTPSISHQVVFKPLMKELARRGHDLVVITTDPVFPKGQVAQNITEIDVHDLSYKIWKDFFQTQGSKISTSKAIRQMLSVLSEVVEKQIQTKEVQELIRKKEKFDLLFIEACAYQALEITHVFKAPTIQFSSLGANNLNYQVLGVPLHPLIYPTIMNPRVYNLTLWEKLQVIYNEIMLRFAFWEELKHSNAVLRKRWGPNAPTFKDLAKNIDMLFINSHHLWEGNRPVPPGVVYFNGLHLTREQKLPKELEKYLDSSVHGVIYMSMGTNISPKIFPSKSIKVLMQVFAKLPYNVLLKWDKDFQIKTPKNVKVSDWFPQADLLKHPKIKLFITQGGLQSTDEALMAGVPLLVFPMMGDQYSNAEKCVYYKIGLKLDITTITEKLLEKSIGTVINDTSYRQNVVNLRNLMNDLPQTSLERAVWWTEYVIRHGGAKHYRSPLANVTWSEYLMLDVVLTLLLGAIIVVILIFIAVHNILRVISRISGIKIKTN